MPLSTPTASLKWGARFLLIALALLPVVASAAPIQLSPEVSVERVDTDCTVQDVPALGAGKYLCLWKGDAMLAFFLVGPEAKAVDPKTFPKEMLKSIKSNGAKKDKSSPGSVTAADGTVIPKLEVEYESADGKAHQFYYLVRSAKPAQIVIVTLTDQTAAAEVAKRADALIATVKTTETKK